MQIKLFIVQYADKIKVTFSSVCSVYEAYINQKKKIMGVNAENTVAECIPREYQL